MSTINIAAGPEDPFKIHQPPAFKPDTLILINGKRKSGKDYVTDKLIKRFGANNVAVLRIAAPIKHYWAVKNDLDYSRMLDTSAYKEAHRYGMVEWSIELRKTNYGYFNVEAIRMGEAEGRPIWICSDIRHRPDYDWFMEFYADRIKTVRVKASPETRVARGWVFTPGIDDGPSECGLDPIEDGEWNLCVHNDGDESAVEQGIEIITGWVQEAQKGNNHKAAVQS